MPYPRISPAEIAVFPLTKRASKSNIEKVAVNPDAPPPLPPYHKSTINFVARQIRQARAQQRAVILAFGAHLIKNGLSPVLIRLMEEGWVTHLATNGAGGIHDWEFAWQGCSEEDVRQNVATGCFGAWEETGKYINLAVLLGALKDMGYGESLGALIDEQQLSIPTTEQLQKTILEYLRTENNLLPAAAELFTSIINNHLPTGLLPIEHPFNRYSVFGNAFHLRIPVTVHPGIGYDIIYNHPLANGAALGRGAHLDFQSMVHSVSQLNGGVFLSIGSAIMAPQVFEKSLSFANNLLLQKGQEIIKNFTIVVNDLQTTTWNWADGEPPKSSPDYYFRFLKSFYRMGGKVTYVAADNRIFMGNLYAALRG
ncbi:MAG: hypothetical protein EHM72_01270 [Calditrichaeota bacterium]|nr:MAG: hypothetical protein EHM72_01270 [Calditrichota bacterium]